VNSAIIRDRTFLLANVTAALRFVEVGHARVTVAITVT
jgi:hypothetical protein